MNIKEFLQGKPFGYRLSLYSLFAFLMVLVLYIPTVWVVVNTADQATEFESFVLTSFIFFVSAYMASAVSFVTALYHVINYRHMLFWLIPFGGVLFLPLVVVMMLILLFG